MCADTTEPVVVCPADLSVEYDGGASAVVTYSGESVTDNSGATLTVTCDPASDSLFTSGDNTVTCSATDAAGNTGTCDFTVTVQGTILVLNLPRFVKSLM